MISNELGLHSPSLPAYLLYPVALLCALIILFVMARTRDRAAMFVIGAAWLRYVMSAFHTITYRPLAAGMSANALASMGMFAVGLLTIDWRHLALRFLLPIYVLIAMAIISAVANGGVTPGLITVITKHGYLIVILLSVFGAMRRARGGDFMASMLWAFLPTIIWQIFSIVLGVGKATETDATAISYIGGYNHEAAFSVILATCLTVACFTTQLNKTLQTGVILLCVAGIVMANYRTTLVGVAPLLLMFFAFSSLRRFPLRDRPFVVSALIVIAAIGLGLASLLFAERFQDVTVATSGDVNFFKPPEYYSVEESRLLSGRPKIWSAYIYAWLDGDLTEHVIGYGPESWNDVFPLYAHNTLVNYLYEYGVVGVVVILWVWFSMLAAAIRTRHLHTGVLIGAHLSYLVLNMSTMPMWMIEGNILYGIICGYTLYLLSLQSKPAASG
ncbi:MAG: O-antigen ligase family protein [Hyphomonadaceae bacterium]